MEVLGVPSYWAMLIIQNGGEQQAPAANNNQRVFQKDPSTPPAQFHTWSNHGQVCFFLLMLFSLEKRSAKHGRGKRQDFFNQRPHSCTKNAALSETVRNYSASLPRHRDGERPRGLILEVAGLWQMNCRTDFFEKNTNSGRFLWVTLSVRPQHPTCRWHRLSTRPIGKRGNEASADKSWQLVGKWCNDATLNIWVILDQELELQLCKGATRTAALCKHLETLHKSNALKES
jgi:hypothetical protein